MVWIDTLSHFCTQQAKPMVYQWHLSLIITSSHHLEISDFLVKNTGSLSSLSSTIRNVNTQLYKLFHTRQLKIYNFLFLVFLLFSSRWFYIFSFVLQTVILKDIFQHLSLSKDGSSCLPCSHNLAYAVVIKSIHQVKLRTYYSRQSLQPMTNFFAKVRITLRWVCIHRRALYIPYYWWAALLVS